MLASEPAPTGPARRRATPPVFSVTAIDDPALPEVLAELAAARADDAERGTSTPAGWTEFTRHAGGARIRSRGDAHATVTWAGSPSVRAGPRSAG